MTLTVPSPTAAIVVAALIYYIIPSVLEPVIWKEPFELPELRGALAPNQALKAATHLCRDNCKSPESSAIDPSNGYIYSSLGDGRIVELSQDGVFKRNVFFSGGYFLNLKESPTYSGVGLTGPGVEDLMNECHKEAVEDKLAWDKEKEKTCGRPLGIRYVNGYVSIEPRRSRAICFSGLSLVYLPYLPTDT
jgi:Adipocyte plasma membrane-associated protein-like, N-terminal